MQTSKAHAQWKGNLKQGKGQIEFGSEDGRGAFKSDYSFATRFTSESGTTPEQLLGAAHAGCFSMAFANMLDEDGYPADSIQTVANVEMDPDSLSIPKITLTTECKVPNIPDDTFQEIATKAKENCPVSKLFSSAEIELQATLK